MSGTDQDSKKPGILDSKASKLAPVGTAALAYLKLRHHRSPLSPNAPKALQAMRKASFTDGFTRVHLHNKKPGAIKKFITEMTMPADSHVHLTAGKSYSAGKKKYGPVFDPENTGYFKSKHPVGQTDALTKSMDKGKLQEYQIAKKHGLKLPETTRATKPSIPAGMIAKPGGGSMSGMVITQKTLAKHDPNSRLLKNYKSLRGQLNKRMSAGEIDSSYIGRVLNKHQGHSHYLAEQFKKNPNKFVLQPKISIKDEYRVHALHGEPMGITTRRFGLSFGNKAEAEKAVSRHLKNVDPKLRDKMMALDVAKDAKGKWHIIETNAGTQSGFLTPNEHAVMAPGPKQLYKYVTGRHARSVAIAGALGAAGATEMGRLAVKGLTDLDMGKKQEPTPEG